jgi:hypothetical protein
LKIGYDTRPWKPVKAQSSRANSTVCSGVSVSFVLLGNREFWISVPTFCGQQRLQQRLFWQQQQFLRLLVGGNKGGLSKLGLTL